MSKIRVGDTGYTLTEDGWREFVYLNTEITIRGVTFETLVGVNPTTLEPLVFPKSLTKDFKEALDREEISY